MSKLTIADWHDRYVEQAEWDTGIRNHIFSRINLKPGNRILDVGSGTGALEQGFLTDSTVVTYPLEIDFQSLLFSKKIGLPDGTCGNAYQLPYALGAFDITLCHYLLLWLNDPLAALREMRRVTRSGGYILLLAEPDYAHRIDHPASLSELGELQRNALIRQGANPDIGPSVGELLHQAGIHVIETGLSGGRNTPADTGAASEWRILTDDLKDLISSAELSRLRKIDFESRLAGTRVLFVPVFYAIGRVE